VLISMCMIVRNEAERLPAFLECFAPLVDEFCVIDTGSTDGTPQIEHPKLRLVRSKKFTAELPREGDWLSVLDPDFTADAAMLADLRSRFEAGSCDGFDMVICDVVSGGETNVMTRFWRRELGMRYIGSCHEEIPPPKGSRAKYFKGARFVHLRLAAEMDRNTMTARREFYAGILEDERRERPHDVAVLWKLAREYKILGMWGRAMGLFQEVLGLCDRQPDQFIAWQMVWLFGCSASTGDRGGAGQPPVAGVRAAR